MTLIRDGLWLLPTYGRPKRCQDTLDSIMAAGCSSRGLVLVDGDPDPAYRDLRLPDGWKIHFGSPNRGQLPWYNIVFHELYPGLSWYGSLNDDFHVVTPGWDVALVEAATPYGFASSADGWQDDRRMHGAAVYGGELLKAFGFWSPPGLIHCYADDFWERAGRELECWRYLPEIMVEHRHVFNGKAPTDGTYLKAYSHLDGDRVRYENLTRNGVLPAAIGRARAVLARRAEEQSSLGDHAYPDPGPVMPEQIVEEPEGGAPVTRAEFDAAAASLGLPAFGKTTGIDIEERASQRSVIIATPIAREPVLEYTMSILRLERALTRLGIRYEFFFTAGSSNLPRSRNVLAARFLASGYTDLLFVDDDMGWDPEAVVRVLASDKPVAAAVGRKKVEMPNSDPNVWCVQWLPGSEQALVTDELGFVEVARVGTAFMRIRREALEHLIAAHPEWKRRGPLESSPEVAAQYYQFFRFETDDGDEAGEDFVFCDRCRAAGLSVWIDPSIRLSHVGPKAYAGAVREIMLAA